jgi:4-amino-4-deoxy-L-arabinose transferase-like glycosyltransferase
MTLSILYLRSTAAEGPALSVAPPSEPAIRRRPRVPRAPRIAIGALLALTALAYIWNLGASGDANSFYAAAVQAGTESWKAFLFGSLDKASFITVDKPPASLWVMELSGRVFGFSSWSMLVPEALEGVAAVALLAAAVRRWFGEWAGIAAGAVFALTPVAALMFRFNNPDALLVLLLVASAYSLTRALERGATRWIVAAGALLGFAFLAKMLQAFIVLPGFALVYVVAAPGPLRRRIWQTLAGGATVVAACGWWLLAVALWPVADRPMIDGSSSNNIFDLIFGYNGLGRVFGGSGDGGGAAGGGHGIGGGIGSSFGGATGPLRLFNSLMGGQASWLLPAALIALVAGLLSRRGAPRTDRTRAALLLWGSWLVVTALVFSESSGIIHTYYTVALAPAIGALVGIGAWQAWQHRTSGWAQAIAGLTVAVTAAWAEVLLGRSSSWHPWLATLLLAAAVIALGLLALAALPRISALGAASTRRLASAGAVLAIVACLAGPVAYTLDTVSTAHTGSVPTAGPASATRGGFGGGSGGPGGGRPAEAGGGRASFTGGASGGPGGGTTSVSAALRRALETDSSRYRWVAATSGSQSAASYELATGGQPVMAIGGFSGEGGNLSLAQFKAYVKTGEIHYYIASGGGMGGGAGDRGGSSSSILQWVESHYAKQTIGGTTVYNLTLPKSVS